MGQALFILVFQLSLDDFQLQPPVTFRLKSGSGPVRITGRHQIGEKSGPSPQASLPLHSCLGPSLSLSVSCITGGCPSVMSLSLPLRHVNFL